MLRTLQIDLSPHRLFWGGLTGIGCIAYTMSSALADALAFIAAALLPYFL